MQHILPGIWKISLGEPETDTPIHLLQRIPKYEALNRLPKITDCPIQEQDIVYQRMNGDGSLPCTLIEDDGFSFDFEKGMMNKVKLSWNQGNPVGMIVREGEYSVPHYTVIGWERINRTEETICK